MPHSEVGLSFAVGDYLKAIWIIANGAPASTSALAQQLGIAAPSVSAMLGRLEEMGLVEYERYRGVRLTARGEREALRLVRRHRLIETFLIEHLGYSWDEVHHEAEALEHVITDTFTERLAQLLRHPSHDPHGDPIPRNDGDVPETPNIPLAELEPGETLLVSRLLTQDGDALSYLGGLGILPGRSIAVVGREPIGGLVHLRVEGETRVLSKELAMLVRGGRTAAAAATDLGSRKRWAEKQSEANASMPGRVRAAEGVPDEDEH